MQEGFYIGQSNDEKCCRIDVDQAAGIIPLPVFRSAGNHSTGKQFWDSLPGGQGGIYEEEENIMGIAGGAYMCFYSGM